MRVETVGAKALKPLVKTTLLSHGTLECHDFAASRQFYEEFLGLDCVRHNKAAMLIRKGGYWCVVCVQMGEKVHPQRIFNHWGLDVATKREVDQAHKLAIQHKEKFGIQQITTPGDQHGVYSFYLRDRDSNWWEFQCPPDGLHDNMYERGDVILTQ